jgi:cysteinyl-tRNA synthetase
MNDDFNTPILIAQLFEGVRFINILKMERNIEYRGFKIIREMTDFVFDLEWKMKKFQIAVMTN